MDNLNQTEKDYKTFFSEADLQAPQPEGSVSAEQEQDYLFGGDLSNFDIWIKHEEFRIKKYNEENERSLRSDNAKKTHKIALFWSLFICLVILLHGFGKMARFHLSQTEFMFICGTLTTSVLTFYLIVIRNLFPKR